MKIEDAFEAQCDMDLLGGHVHSPLPRPKYNGKEREDRLRERDSAWSGCILHMKGTGSPTRTQANYSCRSPVIR